MFFNLEDKTVDMNCEKCDKNFTFSLDEVGETINCPNCNISINLQDAGFHDAMKEVEDSLKNFMDNLSI